MDRFVRRFVTRFFLHHLHFQPFPYQSAPSGEAQVRLPNICIVGTHLPTEKPFSSELIVVCAFWHIPLIVIAYVVFNFTCSKV